MTIIHRVEQNSTEWYRLRMGIPTASEFDNIITPAGKETSSERRRKYMARLIAERLLKWQADSLEKIEHIQNGKMMEPFAVAQYEEITGVETEQVGFMTTDDGRIGASPDRLIVGKPFVLEVKCPSIPIQTYYLAFGHAEHYKPQVQGQLYVAGQEHGERGDFIAYNKLCPQWITTTERDVPYIAKMHEYLDRFCDELDEATERVRKMGTFQPFLDVLTPEEAARLDGSQQATGDPLDDAWGTDRAALATQRAAAW